MTTSLEPIQELLAPHDMDVELSSFAAFRKTFPLQGERLYAEVFRRNSDIVQTQKPKFAVANLEKILTATFEVSSVSGFDRMSLRDLSRQTGMSMGAIYSCIGKKEDIALMVADIVRLSSDLTRQHAMQARSNWAQIKESIRFHLYASTLLQPWYFFLFFETRSLPEQQQQASKQIELDGIKGFEEHIMAGVKQGEFATNDARMIANTIVVLMEDWYLKPWKNRLTSDSDNDIARHEKQISTYHQSIVDVVQKLLAKP
ncbi:TetR/AcrR family transcriptional regulator [Arenicella xantha]|uniref:TetR family transcriptional regulator n=1 Tax=Arenicella xantha TaxID=644221 RepID=A0A395JMG0_9GAMM|nr:TetR/AcrR family transcriptional regulator [Arenicella xantha]RBP51605.1 TetR family transcriptional regulator [Arenicella xantha]